MGLGTLRKHYKKAVKPIVKQEESIESFAEQAAEKPKKRRTRRSKKSEE